ncbi:hypothetical protein SPRG_08384 [Saprolegnia parasitica CBS 223.65]|uniref:RING-type domain-containing protein n=1 Tax=Saprolegnia parasitica (strain CBS 223.65) TaxID=695850 RepID=A0A067CAW6_SAPPC|nr:hypothetical protein SPRG_08384 [Saprolegnia parasitica CBS 223.65]KDO26310.1 hypothetical protein SPRG_08384 [Saprolegnia parasitica CBS 223.65]|eukprot:XP_012203011.1 hypothetical protein SPRG_08384 [Saprolegnia parasitica CBS 223.65]
MLGRLRDYLVGLWCVAKDMESDVVDSLTATPSTPRLPLHLDLASDALVERTPKSPGHRRSISLGSSPRAPYSPRRPSFTAQVQSLPVRSPRPPYATQEAMLMRNVHIKFVKARGLEDHRTRYVLYCTNLVSGRRWEVIKGFRDFYALKVTILRNLLYGHKCEEICPWLYAYISSNFPRRHLFRSHWRSVVLGRMQELQVFFDYLQVVLRHHATVQPNTSCRIITYLLPKLLVDFFYGTAHPPSEAEASPTFLDERPRASMKATATDCAICCLPLSQVESCPLSPSIVQTGDDAYIDEDTRLDAQLRRQLSHTNSITTLACGHRFHDECILEKLNQRLHCPQCGLVLGDDAPAAVVRPAAPVVGSV